ncbi:MAG: WYL domain-containing protein [Acidimicrobiia bacterium]|nr:WYL domain-containing protein [Acidimicrobiia bacterium]
MGRRAESRPVERVVALAAYVSERAGSPPTRAEIVTDVPGYPEGDEANRKALRRDLSDLAEHFGIETDCDPAEDRYRLRRPFLTSDERRVLIAAATIAQVQGLGEPDPDDIGGGVDEYGRFIFITVPHRTLALFEAIRARIPVTFVYHGRTRTFHAYALGEMTSHWYVTGLEQESGGQRQFRIDRIESDVSPAGAPGSYEVPGDFDAPEAIRGVDPFRWGPDPKVTARVLLGADHVQGFVGEYGGTVVDHIDGDAVVEVEVAHYDAFRWRLLSFGTHARVLSPPALVDHVRSHLTSIVRT